jgi:hypothetical protein
VDVAIDAPRFKLGIATIDEIRSRELRRGFRGNAHSDCDHEFVPGFTIANTRSNHALFRAGIECMMGESQ